MKMSGLNGKIFLSALAILCFVLACVYFHPNHKMAPAVHERLADISELTTSRKSSFFPPKVSLSEKGSTAATAPASKREQINAWIKSGRPEDKFSAYRLIRACVDARRDELLVADRVANGGAKMKQPSSATCGDIDAGQISMKLNLIRDAALAGVHGAASNFVDEGPRGEGYGDALDPTDAEAAAFSEQMKNAIDAGAKSGDWWSLAMRSQREELAATPDYRQAIDDLDAANEAYRKEFGRDMSTYKEDHGRLVYFSNKGKVG